MRSTRDIIIHILRYLQRQNTSKRIREVQKAFLNTEESLKPECCQSMKLMARLIWDSPLDCRLCCRQFENQCEIAQKMVKNIGSSV